MSKANYYAIIPADIRYSDKLPMWAKLLYGEITALCSKEWYCRASNQYFADLYMISVRTIKRRVKDLVKIWAIKAEVSKGDGNVRTIELTTLIARPQKSKKKTEKKEDPSWQNWHDPSDKNDTTPSWQNWHDPSDKNVPPYIYKNNTVSNTDILSEDNIVTHDEDLTAIDGIQGEVWLPSTEISEKSVSTPQPPSKSDILKIWDWIEEACDKYGLPYDPWVGQRSYQFWKHYYSKKFRTQYEKFIPDLKLFIFDVVKASTYTQYARSINSVENFYRNWSDVIIKFQQQHRKKSTDKKIVSVNNWSIVYH